jgi:hypothetical protein
MKRPMLAQAVDAMAIYAMRNTAGNAANIWNFSLQT